MPLTKLRRKAIQNFFKEKQLNSQEWSCCNQTFTKLNDIGRHVDEQHQPDIDAMEQLEIAKQKESEQEAEKLQKLKQRRAPKGASDPIQVQCQCESDAYKVILFYKYTPINDPVQFLLDHERYCASMTGKVRIASEGINATLAGSNQDIDTYLNWITQTQPFHDRPDLIPSSLSDPTSPRYLFFKPSRGCPHIFSDLSLKLVDEICPLGQSSVQLNHVVSHTAHKLAPPDFHKALQKDNTILLDTRNYYESKIGHFQGAIQPPIRKFSQFPDYIERNKEVMRGKTILTYCTGGIRCEKATAYMRQVLPDETILMLDGGIHNYMEWWKHNEQEEALWQGKNYVFDARQSLGLEKSTVVSRCQVCNEPWDTYRKCASSGCHLLVLCCDPCMTRDGVYCCQSCKDGIQNGSCTCEQNRRQLEQIKLYL